MDRILKAKMDITRVLDQIEQIFEGGVKNFLSDIKNPLALKYLLVEVVEAIADICQHLLAKTKGIVCEGYVDCILKAGKASIITASLSEKIRRLADLRNILIHRYWVIDDRQVYKQTMENKKYLRDFIEQIDVFLASLKK